MATVQQLQTFLQDKDEPAEPPTLVQAVTKQMSQPQATEMSLQRTSNVEPTEQLKRFMMAQPAWKTEMQRNHASVQPPPSQATLQLLPKTSTLTSPAMPTLTTVEEDDRMAHLQDGHWSPPNGYQSSTSTQRAGDAAWDAQDDGISLEGEVLGQILDLQTDNIR